MNRRESGRPYPSRLLAVSLPSPLQRQILRLGLLTGQEAREEAGRWLTDNPRAKYLLGDATNKVKRLLGLLHYGLQRNGVATEGELRDYLAVARGRERMRGEAVRKICAQVFSALETAGLGFVVLRGAAVDATAWPEPFLRHCHDLDLMVAPGEATAAVACLEQAGLKAAAPPDPSDEGSRWLMHPSGFPVGLHTAPFRVPAWNQGSRDIMRSAVSAGVAGTTVKILGPADGLLHVCCHAMSYGSFHSPCWAADAWFLIRANPSLDWDRVLSGALRGPGALPFWVALDFLAQELEAPVPGEALRRIRESAADSDAAAHRSALEAAMMVTRGRPGVLLRAAADEGCAMRVAWSLAFPPAGLLRRRMGAARATPLAWLYGKRFARIVHGAVHRQISGA